MLRTIWIAPAQEEYARITALLPTIFPKEELSPHGVEDDALPYLCFYDDDAFIGFAQVLKRPEIHYLRYMAMLPEHRSKGYGGQMLELILKERGDIPLALDIEPLDERAANYQQRVRRHNFYLRHGLVDTGYLFEFGGNPFQVMSTGEPSVPVLMQRYCQEEHRFAPGFLRFYKADAAHS